MASLHEPSRDKMKAVIYKVGPVNDQYQPTYPGITNRYRYPKAIAASTVIYILFGIAGFVWGTSRYGAVAGDILTQFDSDDHVIMVGKLGLLVSLLLNVPLLVLPLRDLVIELCCGNGSSEDGAEDDLLPSVEVEAAAASASAAAAAAGKVTIDADWTFMGVTTSMGTHLLLTVGIFVVTLGITIWVPTVEKIWGFAGSSVGISIGAWASALRYAAPRLSTKAPCIHDVPLSFLSPSLVFIFPSAVYLKLRGHKPEYPRLFFARLMLISSLVLVVLCTAFAIENF